MQPYFAQVTHRIGRDDEVLHAPQLLDLEVAQTLRRGKSSGLLDTARALEALDDLASLGIVRHPHEDLIERVWELRHNLTAYDAAYVALAEVLDAALLTRDARIARAPGHWAKVEVC